MFEKIGTKKYYIPELKTDIIESDEVLSICSFFTCGSSNCNDCVYESVYNYSSWLNDRQYHDYLKEKAIENTDLSFLE